MRSYLFLGPFVARGLLISKLQMLTDCSLPLWIHATEEATPLKPVSNVMIFHTISVKIPKSKWIQWKGFVMNLNLYIKPVLVCLEVYNYGY